MAKLDMAVKSYEFLEYSKKIALAPPNSISQEVRAEAKKILYHVHSQIHSFLDDYSPLLSSDDYNFLLHNHEHEEPIFQGAYNALLSIESHLILDLDLLEKKE